MEDNALRLLTSRNFASFEELVELAKFWNTDFRQIAKSGGNSKVHQIQAGNILLSTGSFDCYVDQQGHTPQHMRTIAVPHGDSSNFEWFGRRIDNPAVLVFPNGGEIHSVSRPGFHVTSISIPEQIIESYCERNFESTSEKVLGSIETVVNPDQSSITSLLQSLHLLTSATHIPLTGGANWQSDLVTLFEELLLETLFTAPQDAVKNNLNLDYSSRTRVRDQAVEYIHSHLGTLKSIQKLCKAVDTSERTLRAVFDREFGISPKRFLFGQKMHRVHRELWNADPSETSVSVIARKWGFSHLSQFAKDYRKLYGELPSQTLLRLPKQSMRPMGA